MNNLYKLKIEGFKSIKSQELEFAPLNVFIGGNGAGKSNLVSVFHFLRRIVDQELQTYTGEAGGANAILYFGRKKTDKLSMRIEFRPGSDANIYEFVLIPTDDDRFIFERENAYYWATDRFDATYLADSWKAHREARIIEEKNPSPPTYATIWKATAFTTFMIPVLPLR